MTRFRCCRILFIYNSCENKTGRRDSYRHIIYSVEVYNTVSDMLNKKAVNTTVSVAFGYRFLEKDGENIDEKKRI